VCVRVGCPVAYNESQHAPSKIPMSYAVVVFLTVGFIVILQCFNKDYPNTRLWVLQALRFLNVPVLQDY
jgi:hypothetical protein